MSLRERFTNFFKRDSKEEDIEEPLVEQVTVPKSLNESPLHIRIDEDLKKELKAITIYEGTTMSNVVRLAIKEYVDKKTQKPKTKNQTPRNKTHSKKRTRANRPPEVLPNGLELASSQCELYKEVYYDIDGQIKSAGGMIVPLNINQLAHLMDHMDEIPKKGMENRRDWCNKKYGVSTSIFDKIIWNLYRGTFNGVFEYYYNKNYRINFDDNGNLKLGE